MRNQKNLNLQGKRQPIYNKPRWHIVGIIRQNFKVVIKITLQKIRKNILGQKQMKVSAQK